MLNGMPPPFQSAHVLMLLWASMRKPWGACGQLHVQHLQCMVRQVRDDADACDGHFMNQLVIFHSRLSSLPIERFLAYRYVFYPSKRSDFGL